MKLTKSLTAIAVGALLLGGCAEMTRPADTVSQAVQQDPSAKANALFDAIFEENIMSSPVSQTYMGIKKDYDQWDEISEAEEQVQLQRTKSQLARLKQLDRSQLDAQTQLSFDLLTDRLQQQIDDFKWRHHNYAANQMRGWHASAVSFLINAHRIGSVEDAKAYISRLKGMEKLLSQVTDSLKLRESKNVMPPKFVFKYVISDSQNVITGAPFDNSGEDSPLYGDFKKKVAKLDISDAEKQQLIRDAADALTHQVKAGYEGLIALASAQEKRATTDDGAWKLPNGEAYYNNALKRTTTTDLTADEIHTIGLEEVARIHGEMRDIMKKVGFKGDLQEFFAFMRTDKQFYFPNTEEGKAEYLKQATAMIDNMKSRLDELFIVKPKADLVVKQVEPFREKSAGKAFYNQPAPDGSRPGYYYANLYNMADMPIYQMEALAFHEGIPGHHMQIAIAQELESVPKFRRFGGYTAYIEGWGLYSEFLPKEHGFYQDPYSDFGRLAMELWRACRLVVDTGMHAKKWTREDAIDYLKANTPNPEGDVVKAIERYIVMPSQATAYKIGMLKILELRSMAKDKLGDKFDLRQFHDVILKNGPVPLSVLEQQVNNWIASKG